jgi:hypothetical protein
LLDASQLKKKKKLRFAALQKLTSIL